MSWCPWYERTGTYLRHNRSQAVAQVVWEGKRDYQVELPSGVLVTWFKENVTTITEEEYWQTRRRTHP